MDLSFIIIATASDDGKSFMFDLRASQIINTFVNPTAKSASTATTTTGASEGVAAATCVSFSNSGRLVFVGYEDPVVTVYDVLTGQRCTSLTGHTSRICSLGLISFFTLVSLFSFSSSSYS